jgi:hypothetical protein
MVEELLAFIAGPVEQMRAAGLEWPVVGVDVPGGVVKFAHGDGWASYSNTYEAARPYAWQINDDEGGASGSTAAGALASARAAGFRQ